MIWRREIKHCCVRVRMGGEVENNLLFPDFIKTGRNSGDATSRLGGMLWQLSELTSLFCKDSTYIKLCQWQLNLLKAKEKSLWSPSWHERVAQKGEEFLRKEKDRIASFKVYAPWFTSSDEAWEARVQSWDDEWTWLPQVSNRNGQGCAWTAGRHNLKLLLASKLLLLKHNTKRITGTRITATWEGKYLLVKLIFLEPNYWVMTVTLKIQLSQRGNISPVASGQLQVQPESSTPLQCSFLCLHISQCFRLCILHF